MKTQKKHILKTAFELFLEKGMDNVSVRDISKKANVNVAMINYHFGSKENLEIEIIKETLKHYAKPLNKIMNDNLTSWKDKIKLFVSSSIDLLIVNPGLAKFFMNILLSKSDVLMQLDENKYLYDTKQFARQIKDAALHGEIRKIKPEQIYINIASLVVFPIVISTIITDKNHLSPKMLQHFMKSRKKMIYDMLITHCKV